MAQTLTTRCPDCDLSQVLPSLRRWHTARCSRCGSVLRGTGDLGDALALTFAALILFVIANAMPFMTFEFDGSEHTAYILTGVYAFYTHGFLPLGVLILFASFLAPLVRLLCLLYVLVPLKMGFVPWRVAWVFRFTQALRSWGMLEVYLIGVLVAVVKLGELASVSPGLGFYFFLPLVYVWTAVQSQVDPEVVWAAAETRLPASAATAQRDAAGTIFCEACGRADDAAVAARRRCLRCGAPRHWRRPNSISRTWALVLTAAILYIPANVYPMMTITLLGKTEAHTILDGVQTLFAAGLWEIGGVVFIASIAVPLLKLVGLSHLLLSVQRKQRNGREVEKTRLYRVISYIGRWSMIDMFMLSILVALVHLGTLATIDPGVASTCFAAVVVITIFAAEAFDPRLMWDQKGRQE